MKLIKQISETSKTSETSESKLLDTTNPRSSDNLLEQQLVEGEVITLECLIKSIPFEGTQLNEEQSKIYTYVDWIVETNYGPGSIRFWGSLKEIDDYFSSRGSTAPTPGNTIKVDVIVSKLAKTKKQLHYFSIYYQRTPQLMEVMESG